MVAVIASIAARSVRRSRPKSTHPVIPHMLPPSVRETSL